MSYKELHTFMHARVCINGNSSERFCVTTAVKQGCVIARILVTLFLAAMLDEALASSAEGIVIRFRTDGGIFNIRRLQAKTKVHLQFVRDLLCADDSGVFAHTEDHLQRLMNHFSSAAKNFGLTISSQKTEVLYQPPPGQKGTALIEDLCR